MALLCIAGKDDFPDAFKRLRAWIQRPSNLSYLIHRFHESEISKRFPEKALDFLSLVTKEQSLWAPRELNECLSAIVGAAPELENDPRFEQLTTYVRQHGEG